MRTLTSRLSLVSMYEIYFCNAKTNLSSEWLINEWLKILKAGQLIDLTKYRLICCLNKGVIYMNFIKSFSISFVLSSSSIDLFSGLNQESVNLYSLIIKSWSVLSVTALIYFSATLDSENSFSSFLDSCWIIANTNLESSYPILQDLKYSRSSLSASLLSTRFFIFL